MPVTKKGKMIRLVQAAAIGRMTYQQMLNEVLRQTVRGYQDSKGHWWASEADAQKLGRARQTP